MIDIESVELRNFLGYGDYVTIINFKDCAGATLIIGEHEGNDEKRCAAGKTSLLEAILWCMHGSTTFALKPGDNIINWNIGNNCYVKIKTVDGYSIMRTRKLNGKDELIVEKDGKDVTLSTAIPMQAFINSQFKIDYGTSVASIIFGQSASSFLENSEPARRKVIERLFKISNLNGRAEVADDKIKILKKDIAVLAEKISKNDVDIQSSDNSIASTKLLESGFVSTKKIKIDKISEWLSAQKDQFNLKTKAILEQIVIDSDRLLKMPTADVAAVEAEWNNFNNTIGPVDEKIKIYDRIIRESEIDINVVKSTIASMTNKVIELTNSIKNATAYPTTDEITKLWSDYETKMAIVADSKSVLAGIVNKVSGEMTLLNDKKTKLNDFKNISAQCSECNQVVTDEYRAITENKYNNEILLIEGRISEYNATSSSIGQKIASFSKAIAKPQFSVDFIVSKSNDSAAAASNLLELTTKLEEMKNEIVTKSSKFESNKAMLDKIKILRQSKVPKMTVSEAISINNVNDEIKKVINLNNGKIDDIAIQLKEHISKAAADIIAIENESNPYTSMVASAETARVLLVEGKTKLENDRVLKTVTLKHLEYIKDAYANKRKIKAWWISKLIPFLNSRIKYYLNCFEIKDSIEFDEFLAVKMSRWGYLYHSGGERKSIDLSVMFGLRDLHTSVFGQQSNLLLLDEVDGKLDTFYINKLVSIIRDDILARNDGLTNVLIISHKGELHDRFPNKIRVKNKGGNAYIVNE